MVKSVDRIFLKALAVSNPFQSASFCISESRNHMPNSQRTVRQPPSLHNLRGRAQLLSEEEARTRLRQWCEAAKPKQERPLLGRSLCGEIGTRWENDKEQDSGKDHYLDPIRESTMRDTDYPPQQSARTSPGFSQNRRHIYHSATG